ncbi:hypothetical protein SLEP1_g54896 [Rubroshorea leprosula]|uniref:Uncharacterized protein n=1 Tax=Rubroshorea leprosula TaxID=152421 RepID=A0AAV5ME01_9ROSI|nr:hypothetical protein SLEP1_g54896 [Rubroshorea leprosula]
MCHVCILFLWFQTYEKHQIALLTLFFSLKARLVSIGCSRTLSLAWRLVCSLCTFSTLFRLLDFVRNYYIMAITLFNLP